MPTTTSRSSPSTSRASPRVGKESLLPVPRSATSNKSDWYPPGHGDLFDAISNSGLLDKLIEAGKEYIFVSNVDNLGADVDLKILKVITFVFAKLGNKD